MKPERGRLRVACLSLVACVIAPAVARADATSELCVADSIEGQVLRTHGRLLRAREHLAGCARPECEPAMRAHCAEWLKEATDETPRLELHVVDDRGEALPRAVLHLDATKTSAAEPVEVDPGKHVLLAEYAGRQGSAEFAADRGLLPVRLVIDLRATTIVRPTPKLTYVLAGLAGAGAIAFGAFGASALVQSGHLSGCEPYCSPSLKGSLDVAMVGADVSLGIAAAGALGALIVFLARPTEALETRVGAGVAGASWTF